MPDLESTFTPLVDIHRYYPADLDIRISHMYVHTRGDVDAELAVVTTSGRGLLRRRVNLTAENTMRSIAKALDERAPNIPWNDLLSAAAWRSIEHSRSGDPERLLDDVEHDHQPGWVVAPWWATGPTVLFGPASSGKSYLAMSLAVEVATGTQVVSPYPPAVTGPVLYLDWESEPEDHARRLQRLRAGHDVPRQADIWYRQMRMPLSSALEPVLHSIEQAGIVAAVVDSAGAARMGAPESAEETLKLYRAVHALGVPVLIVDHVAKAAVKARGDEATPFGSIYSVNLARLIWLIDTVWSNDTLSVEAWCTKANDRPLPPSQALRLTFSAGATVWEATDAHGRGDRAPLHVQIERLLHDEGAATAAVIAKRLAVTQSHVRAILSRHSAMFRKEGDAWYPVADTPDDGTLTLPDPM